jgi:RNA polymerase sigma-70 factor (ECF subfamily)
MSHLSPIDILEEISSMRRYARALTRDETAADDVVQDALLKALEKRHTFRPDGSRRGWLLSIVHNVFISSRRSEDARLRRNARFAEMLTSHLEPDQEHAACLYQVARIFAALPDNQRALLHLIAVEGRSYQEAAEILDIPIGTVMSRLSRARAALRGGRGEQKTADRKTIDTQKADDDESGSGSADRFRIVGGRNDD